MADRKSYRELTGKKNPRPNVSVTSHHGSTSYFSASTVLEDSNPGYGPGYGHFPDIYILPRQNLLDSTNQTCCRFLLGPCIKSVGDPRHCLDLGSDSLRIHHPAASFVTPVVPSTRLMAKKKRRLRRQSRIFHRHLGSHRSQHSIASVLMRDWKLNASYSESEWLRSSNKCLDSISQWDPSH